MALKFYTSMEKGRCAKGLELKVRGFRGLTRTFSEVEGYRRF